MLAPLIADYTTGETLTFAAVVAAAGQAVPWVWNKLAGDRTARRAEHREDEANNLTRMDALLRRVDQDRIESIREAKQLGRQVTKLLVKVERAIGWIRVLEARLSEHKIEYKSWVDDDELDDDEEDDETPKPIPAVPQ